MDVSSCNSTLPYTDGDDLIDSDHSISEDRTDDDEPPVREATPLPFHSKELPTPVNRSKKTPSKQVATPKTPVQPPEPRTEKSVDSGVLDPVTWILLAFVLFGCAYGVRNALQKYYTKLPPAAVIHEKCTEFYTLEESYTNIDDNLWDALEVSFRRANAHKRREPGTFLFLHHGSIEMVDRFIENISNITAYCFGGTEPIVLEQKYFQRADIQRDFGEFISQQKAALQKQGIMVVRNLEGIPPKAARAFHSICDPEEPLVDRAVIYFTMDTSKVGGKVTRGGVRSATEEAEMLLYHMWKDVLNPEVLDPLVIRLTEGVYRIV
ncbi:hypothetical protein ZHAS_00021182 [Anopheles sinensis]|uniref:Uncharacterized protein n=1 Tax=Anopheles sinensis TaxID=74873 RepID=A0A084WRQ9_ANOSI|nr:hypothetical protein ZHAS_00021182 [Anopheles sinensis]